jgi:hypothetical protein
METVSNEEKNRALANTFFPPPPDHSTVLQEYEYPKPVAAFIPFTEEQIEKTIANTSSYKALGPDGIYNIVFKCISSILAPYLYYLFNVVITLNTYYKP